MGDKEDIIADLFVGIIAVTVLALLIMAIL